MDGKQLHVATKTLAGLKKYAELWPGEVVAVFTPTRSTPDAAYTQVHRQALPFAIELTDTLSAATANVGAAARVAMHSLTNSELLNYDPARLILISEFPLVERIRSALINDHGIGKLRHSAGLLRKRSLLTAMVQQTGGLQSNGYPSSRSLAKFSRSPLLFFDTRVTNAQVHDCRKIDRPASQSIRLGFSGRHILAKGPKYAVDSAKSLLAEGLPVSLDIFGAGPLTRELKAKAGQLADSIQFHGNVDYESVWVPYVANNIDIMILPHIQGDPSGTYLESAALGVPVVGFDNRALGPLCRNHGIGLTAPMLDRNSLSNTIGTLATLPGLRRRLGENGRNFMREHTFEIEFAKRVDHLRTVADV